MREYAGGTRRTHYLYRFAKRSWMWELSGLHRYGRMPWMDQHSIINGLKISWPAWRSIVNGGEMKMSTFFKICDYFKVPIDAAIKAEAEFQQSKV